MALDLSADSPGGSVELLHDLYSGTSPLIAGQVFMFPPKSPDKQIPAGVQLVKARGKCVNGLPFWSYVKTLRRALAPHLDSGGVAAVHFQNLAFGGAPALIELLPKHPRLALVHGTGLLFAARHRP